MIATKLHVTQVRHVRRALSTIPPAASASTTPSNPNHPEFEKRKLPVKLTPEFYVSKADREIKSQFNVVYKFGEERLARSERSDPTRELNMTAKHWKAHKSPYRKWRHLLNSFRSSPVQRLVFPDMFVSATVGIALTYYNEIILGGVGSISLSMGGFACATTTVGLLAGFRLKESYSRYNEARKICGVTKNTARDLARNTCMWMKDKVQQDRMLKLIRAYPVAFNFHVNRKGGHHNLHESDKNKPKFADRVQAEFQAEMLDIYMDGKHDDDLRRISEAKYKGENCGLEVFNLMGETIAASMETVDAIYVAEMNEQLQRLCGAFGASERILHTPLPTSFTRHTSRVMALWDVVVPFGMYPLMGPYFTIPVCLLTSYAVSGIDDIGVQLEEPFNVLPLFQYSEIIFDSINQTERNYRQFKLHDSV